MSHLEYCDYAIYVTGTDPFGIYVCLDGEGKYHGSHFRLTSLQEDDYDTDYDSGTYSMRVTTDDDQFDLRLTFFLSREEARNLHGYLAPNEVEVVEERCIQD